MPDFVLMAKGTLAAAFAAGLLLLAIARPGKDPSRWRLAAGWVGGLGAGLCAGYWVLGELPRWPPLEDRDRFLIVLLPLALAVEATGMLLRARPRIVWVLRILLATAAAPILLYNSSYITDLDGPERSGTAEWNVAETVLVMGLSSVMLAGIWWLLARLQTRTSHWAVSSVLAQTTLACGATVMLSGTLRGGIVALPIAGSLAGVTLASFAFAKQSPENPSLGIGMIGSFTVCFNGLFFSSLPTSLAIILLLVPLLAWAGEIPLFRKLPPIARAAIGIAAVLVALVLVVVWAQLRFNAALGASRIVPHHAIVPSSL